MKIIKPSVEIMRTGLEDFVTPEQFIEKVGRTCYKSEDKITDDSAAKFVGNLVKRGHEAMIEHYNLIFKTTAEWYEQIKHDRDTLMTNCNIHTRELLRAYMRFTDNRAEEGEVRHIISGNIRAWRDFIKASVEGFGEIPQYMHGMIRSYPVFFPEFQEQTPEEIVNDVLIPISTTELIHGKERNTHMDVTMKFVCDRGVSHEMVRHRVASFAQESTRYCNYSGDKFGGEIAVVRPSWCGEDSKVFSRWKAGCERAESTYFDLLLDGCSPQEARSVLPNSLKTEIIVTMNLDGWRHFFELRCEPSAHPDMCEVACMARYELIDVLGEET